MTIWRGEGGGGDATTDSEINFITSLTNSIVDNTAITTTAADATAALYDSFDDRYLGSKAAAPTLDNDSNALIPGALYWNSVSNQMFVWSGTAWQQTFFSGTNVRSVVTATAGQTVVTTPSYTQGNNTIQVYVNGFKVISGTDYTETSTTSITFTPGLTLSDEVEILIAQPFSVGITSSDAVNYLPAGTGAVATTVQAKLREIKSAADYSTFPNYTSNALSGGFFTQSGAVIQRMTDRLMVGGAVLNDCAFPNVYKDWLTTFQVAAGLSNGSVTSATSAVLNSQEAGGSALITGAQSLLSTSAGASTISSGHFAVNNNTTYATSAWALYAEAHKINATTSSVYACELDTRTLVASINPTPFQQGNVIGLQIASGCELNPVDQFDASCAIQIADNPKKFKAGINFGAASIVGTDGITGTGLAIALAKGHQIAWYNSSGSLVGSILSNCATAANSTNLNFTDSGLQITNSAGNNISFFASGATASNYFTFFAGAAGNPPTIAASGSDTNVDLSFSCQGTGVVKFGAYTAGVVAQAGYITIKDSGGTVRRLLVG